MTAASDAANPMGWQKIGSADAIGKPIVDADKVYVGTMITFDDAAGLDEFEPAQDAAGHIFAGIAKRTVDNADDGLRVDVDSRPGITFWAEAGTGFTPNAGDVGQVAYVEDDQTVCTAANSTNNVRVGRVVAQDGTRVQVRSEPWVSQGSFAGSALTQTYSTADATHAARGAVALTDMTGGTDPGDQTLPVQAALTDYTPHSSGGTTVTSAAATDLDTTAAALETFRDEQAALNTIYANAFALLAAEHNLLILDLADTAAFLNSTVNILKAEGIAS